jgi:dipeptide/tripeptide permease
MAVRGSSDNEASENQLMNDENQPLLGAKRLRYPKSVFFIVLNEFCERFNYYGMRSKLKFYPVHLKKFEFEFFYSDSLYLSD